MADIVAVGFNPRNHGTTEPPTHGTETYGKHEKNQFIFSNKT